jgi:hypothetical protein
MSRSATRQEAGERTMKPPQIDYSTLNDDARRADPYDCMDLLVAGVQFFS